MPSSPRAEDPPTKELFASIHYSIASSLPAQRADQLRHVLDTNGALHVQPGSPDPTLNTLITNSHRFEGWEDVSKRQHVRVVTDKWVEKSVILGKIQLAQYFSPDPAMIFSGIVACASDLPTTDLEVLSAGITALGGQWRTGLTRDVTHLFALNPEGLKYTTAMHYRDETGIRVVLPHWFDDAVRLGMGNLPTKPYEWPDPELLKGADGLISEKENVKAKGKAALVELSQNDVKRNMYATAAIFTPTLGRSSPPTESDLSLILNKVPGPSKGLVGLNLNKVQVWKGRKVVLSRTLELYKGRREAVQVGIERAGGVVLRFDGDGDEPEPVTDRRKQGGEKLSKEERIRRRDEARRVADCDVLVTRWRHGRAYVSACQGGKTVGTLAWLFHVQSSGVLSNPQDQLLHYPVPKRNIEAFSKHVITVTNYTGETREYIKKLIAAMGATFTPSMSGENTALIAAYLGGTKADKAQSWSIPIVNHTWLEDCFIQWRNLTMALEKYIVFPHGVDFSSLLGERGVGVGNQVMDEAEELATVVFEEDEDYLSDREEGVGDRHDMPNGTEASAKEVARGLVGADENGAVSKPHQPTKSTMKADGFKPPEGMDVDFVPPSTAAVITDLMDWNGDGDVDLDEGLKSHDGDAEEEEEEEERPVKSKQSAKISVSAKSGTRRVSRQNQQESEEDDVEVEEVNTRKKKKARTVTVEAVDDEPVVESKKTVKARPKVGKRVQEVIELDSISAPRRAAKVKRVAVEPSPSRSEHESEEEEEEEVITRKKAKTRAVSVVEVDDEEPVVESKKIVKARSKVGKRVQEVIELDSEDELPKQKNVKKKESRVRNVVLSDEEKEEEEGSTEDENHARSRTKTNSRARSVKTAPPEKTSRTARAKAISIPSDLDKDETPPKKSRKRTAPSKSKTGAKKDIPETDNDHSEPPTADEKPKASSLRRRLTVEVVMKSPPKRKGKEVEGSEDDIDLVQQSKKVKSTATPAAGARSEGLLRKAKGDARTRIKRKSIHKEDRTSAESEDEEEERQPVQATSTRRLQNRRKEVANKDKGDRKTSKTKAKTQTKSAGRSKPLRVYTSEDVESEDDETSINGVDASADEVGSDEDLPERIGLPSGSRAKTKGTIPASSKATTRRRESDTRNNNREQPSVAKPSGKPGNPSTPALKRTISVLSPSLAISEKVEMRRPTKVKRMAVKSMDVDDDDDHHSRFTPTSTSGPSVAAPRRNAAAKATQRLHETVIPDLVNYEAQLKKSKGKGRQSVGSLSAFALDDEEEEEGDRERDVGKRKQEEGSDGEIQPRKKRRVSDEVQDTIKAKAKSKPKGKQKANEDTAEVEGNKSSSNVVLLTTQLTLPDDVLRSLTKLGVRMTTRPSECTHLLCPHLVRTEKFLCALTRAPFILSAKWATASAAAKRLLPEKDFALKDPVGENKFDVVLAQAIRRAKTHKGKLLDGKVFYLTPRVSVDKKLLKNVVGACGGEITAQPPSLRIIKAAPEKRHVISCKEDISMWRPIAIEGYKIYTQELLLAGIMKQQIEWDREEFMVEP